MADNHTAEVRSMNMSRIRSTDSKPELLVRKFLFAKGMRYRKNVKKLPGTPDLVFPKYQCVVFINGCFWHHHNCKSFVWPKSNEEYWHKKIDGNVERDARNIKLLEADGWKVIVVWECQLKKDAREKVLNDLYFNITGATL